MKYTRLIFSLSIIVSNFSTAQNFKSLFNGKDLKGWSTVLKSNGRNNDTAHVFSVENGLLHISGNDVGYIITEKPYSDFHLIVEFKWGVNKFPPRENRPRDNGILYHVEANYKVWPRCVECQIQEGDCGDYWLLDSVTAVIDGILTKPSSYTRAIKKKDNEKPTGEWNRVEVISKNGRSTHIVNGVVVNEASNLSVRAGRIAIQTELAEIYYRKIEIREW